MSQTAQAVGKAAIYKSAISPTRAENFPEWFQEVIKAADMAENAPVRGCMIIKPYGYALWENIQKSLDEKIKEVGVQNAYFPLLIPLSFISREADHVEGFAKECAVVTHHRLEKSEKGGLIPSPEAKLEEPFIIRPTSETIIGDSMSRWVQSYRDLPLLLNQWCNVMRWEMRTRLFLRTSEFLWQEGHNAFETREDAHRDAIKMLGVYNDLYENCLAIPGFKGEKTADERFPGAEQSFTIEAMMQDGKALQACTSHNLGQNFAKTFEIKFQGRDGSEQTAWTTSWGLSTRSIGGLIMTHGDDDGLIMPPRVAPHQVAIIPFLKDDQNTAALIEKARELGQRLKAAGVRVTIDASDRRTSDKMWEAIKKGVPIRAELGQRELEQGQITFIRRDLGKESKMTVDFDQFVAQVPTVLDEIHASMYKRAFETSRSRVKSVASVADIKNFFTSGEIGFAHAPVALLDDPSYEQVKKDNGLSSRCLPFEDEGRKVLIGKSY